MGDRAHVATGCRGCRSAGTADSVLHVTLLGTPSVRCGSRELPLRPAEMQLLAYLLLKRDRPVPRGTVAAALWSEGTDDRCRRRLNTTLWRLRRGLSEGAPAPMLASDGSGNLRIDTTVMVCDAIDLEAVAALANHPLERVEPGDAAAIHVGLDRYAGDLLEGACEEWVLAERERLLRLYMAAMFRLMRWHLGQGDTEAAVDLGNRILDKDPLREDVHRALIRCYIDVGARSEALRQYERCRDVLRRELGIEPLPETTSAAAIAHAHAPELAREPRRAGDLLANLHAIRAHLHSLSDAVDGAIAQMDANG